MSTQLESCFAQLLNSIGEDPKRLSLERTPVLAARAFADLTRGYALDPTAILKKDRCPVPKNYQGIIEIPNIPFMSLCEHTFLPFLGTVNISYEPRDYMVGAGVFSSMIEACSKRLQLQEPLTAQIAELLFRVLEPKSVKVQIAARHCCMNGQEMRTQVIYSRV